MTTPEPPEQRLEVARQLASHYGIAPKIDALFVPGSETRGVADAGSDLEFDILWHEPPTRAGPLRYPGPSQCPLSKAFFRAKSARLP